MEVTLAVCPARTKCGVSGGSDAHRTKTVASAGAGGVLPDRRVIVICRTTARFSGVSAASRCRAFMLAAISSGSRPRPKERNASVATASGSRWSSTSLAATSRHSRAMAA
jgi:hypothetical protein